MRADLTLMSSTVKFQLTTAAIKLREAVVPRLNLENLFLKLQFVGGLRLDKIIAFCNKAFRAKAVRGLKCQEFWNIFCVSYSPLWLLLRLGLEVN